MLHVCFVCLFVDRMDGLERWIGEMDWRDGFERWIGEMERWMERWMEGAEECRGKVRQESQNK